MELKSKLEDKLKNNLHNLSLDEVKKIMKIIDGDKTSTIKTTIKKLDNNKPIKVAKKDVNKLKKSTKKIENFNNKLNKQIKNDKLTNKDIEIFKRNA